MIIILFITPIIGQDSTDVKKLFNPHFNSTYK